MNANKYIDQKAIYTIMVAAAGIVIGFYLSTVLTPAPPPPPPRHSPSVSPNPKDTDIEKEIRVYPAANPGYTRHVITLPPLPNEYEAQVELIIGKTLSVDTCNSISFAADMETKSVTGYGYPYYEITKISGPASTLIGCMGPNADRFIRISNLEHVRYNSRLPLVVYVPDGFEVRYRIWTPEETTNNTDY